MPYIDVYGMDGSAPCRIVMMTAECLGVDYKMTEINLGKGEHLTPEYRKLNPQGLIPTVVDGDFKMGESRAIAAYLVNKYGKDDTMYPKDPQTRYMVDKLLYFDMAVLYKAFMDMCYPAVLKNMPPPTQKEHDRLAEVLGWLNDHVVNGKFAAGTDELTIADVSLVATYSTLKACEGVYDHSKHPETEAWFEKCKTLIPNYEKACEKGANQFGYWYKSGGIKF
eukprot:TRINITY_DN6368_c0_g4_i1.p1 TRINITY_DN6368_c0_g4~~TRINITY_DN6368_c0_g4_i1.p1  ORF type:complete len:233 (-),score=54.27 TRINITY_DN6368_c0_g4_i1:428-1096(-)